MRRYFTLLLFIGLVWGQTDTDLQNKLDSLRKELEEHEQERNIKIQEKLDSLRKELEEQKQERNIKIQEKLDSLNKIQSELDRLSKENNDEFDAQNIVLPLYDYPPFPTKPIKPKYSKISSERGNVIIGAFINEKGNVDSAKVVSGLKDPDLNNAALDAVKKTRFRPAKFRHKPVGVYYSIRVTF